VSADPATVPELRVDGSTVVVAASHSPLEIRTLVARHQPDDGTLVILTDCDRHQLGDDLVGRVAGHDIWPLDRWATVKDLFGARAVTAALGRKRYLVDALIEARPVAGYPPLRSGVLD